VVAVILLAACVNPSGQGSSPDQRQQEPETLSPFLGIPAVPVLESAVGELGLRLEALPGSLVQEVWFGKVDDVSLAEKYGEIAFSGTVETVLQGLTEGTDYHVWVRARDEAGYSPWSEAASASASAPGAPGSVSGLALTSGRGSLGAAWSPAAGAAAYDIYCRVSGKAFYRKADTSGGSPFTITGLINGNRYDTAVRARNGSGPGPLSASVSRTLPFSIPQPPVVKTESGRLLVSWETVPAAEYYRVYRGEGGSDTAVLAGTFHVTETSLTLPAGKIYRVWVRAANAWGTAPWGVGTERMLPSAFLQSLEALVSWLVIRASNTPASPHIAALENMDVENGLGSGMTGGDGLRLLYDSFQGRYVALDLDACTGATIGFGQTGYPTGQKWNARPDRDKLVSVVLPEKAVRVGWNNFRDCANLRSVTFPASLRSIGDYAFQDCVSLEAADLPAGIKFIEWEAFSGCSSLRTLIVRASSPPQLTVNALSGCPADLSIRVPAASVAAYKANIGWNAYAAQISALAENE
jgi:hypothetical protein